MSSYRRARVKSVETWSPGALLSELKFDDGSGGRALSFHELTGTVAAGD